MTPDITTIGVGGVIAIYLIEKGYQLFKGVLAKYNPSDEPTQAQSLAKISGNDLNHIYGEIQKQTCQHEKMIEVLVEIKTILNERK